MKQNKLYIFVEGNDDELFFKKIVVPFFLNQYNDVEIFKYAQWKRTKVELFLQSIITLNYDYIFTADIDLVETPKLKKKIIRERFDNVQFNKIMIVIKEIESWYLAGLTDSASENMKLSIPDTTNEITKEDFNAICHTTFHSRIDFMYELLKVFDASTAQGRNESFKYFMEEYDLTQYIEQSEKEATETTADSPAQVN